MIISSTSFLCCSVFVSVMLSVVFVLCVAVFAVFHDLLAVLQLQLVEIMLCYAYLSRSVFFIYHSDRYYFLEILLFHLNGSGLFTLASA